MNINDFYNKKSAELGWEDFGDFLDRMTVANIRDCVFLWTNEYANIVNGQTEQPENGNKSKPLLCDVVLAKQFNSAYVPDSYTKQNENYLKIADEYALNFAKWIIAKNKEEIKNGTLSRITLCSNEQLLEMFKREVYNNIT